MVRRTVILAAVPEITPEHCAWQPLSPAVGRASGGAGLDELEHEVQGAVADDIPRRRNTLLITARAGHGHAPSRSAEAPRMLFASLPPRAITLYTDAARCELARRELGNNVSGHEVADHLGVVRSEISRVAALLDGSLRVGG